MKMILRLARRRGLLLWLIALLSTAVHLVVSHAGTFSIVGSSSSSGNGTACVVLDIHDGDTLKARCNGSEMKVRFFCIDAPELAQAPWGPAARDHLKSLLAGKTITVTPIDRDRYGRTVGVVLANGEPVNLEMVRSGNAAMYRKYCGDARYAQAEAEAKTAGRGIWATPGIQQTPWCYRHDNCK